MSIQEHTFTDTQDLLLFEIRRLFVDSFYDYYQFIESELNRPQGEQIASWLDKIFDRVQNDLLTNQSRIFLMRDESLTLIGLLIVKQVSNHVIYIAQLAIHPLFKRQGYGSLFMSHLRATFGPTVTYEVLTRRVNKPAVDFYARYGAQVIDDKQIVVYGYDPKDFIGFRLTHVD